MAVVKDGTTSNKQEQFVVGWPEDKEKKRTGTKRKEEKRKKQGGSSRGMVPRLVLASGGFQDGESGGKDRKERPNEVVSWDKTQVHM